MTAVAGGGGETFDVEDAGAGSSAAGLMAPLRQ